MDRLTAGLPEGRTETVSHPDATDAELVARLVHGDEAVLAELYDRHAGMVYRTGLRLLGDPGAAEEVVQETMLALWDRAELYDPAVASLGAWLATIARNRSIDRLRARGRRVVALPLSSVTFHGDENAPMDDRILDSGVLLAGAQRELEPAAAGEAAWLRDTLAQAVATLPSLERQVIELAYARDLTQAEIASRLGWPLGTVKTRTRRALASLHEALSEALGPDQGAVAATMLGAHPASRLGRPSAPAPETAASACACA